MNIPHISELTFSIEYRKIYHGWCFGARWKKWISSRKIRRKVTMDSSSWNVMLLENLIDVNWNCSSCFLAIYKWVFSVFRLKDSSYSGKLFFFLLLPSWIVYFLVDSFIVYFIIRVFRGRVGKYLEFCEE